MTLKHWLTFSLLVGVTLCSYAVSAAEPTSAEVFERRILPIFKSPNPSSCTQCHLAGVDLKDYILPSHEKTFLSLRDQGLIDPDNPADSKILRLIAMGGTNGVAGEGAALIGAKVRAVELAAFAEWIRASARDPELRAAPRPAPGEFARPPRPPEVIRHARTDRVLASFEEHVWSQRFRCSGCHHPSGGENRKLVAEHGEEVSWLKDTAEETLRHLLTTDNIKSSQPERSRLLLKPLNEIKHGGGQKMLTGDMTYKAFRTFLEDYARTVGDRYATAADLPKPRPASRMFGTEIWLKLTNTPPAWAERLLQATLFNWNSELNAWEQKPIAISDRGVWGKGRLWQHSLALLADEGSPLARQWAATTKPSLPAGRYLLKIHVDTAERLRTDWTAPLGESELAGQTILESTWDAGYGRMTVVDATRISR